MNSHQHKNSSLGLYKQCLFICITFVLSACSSVPQEPSVPFVYTIVASNDINQDINEQPSSVVIRVFQLAEIGNFTAARYEDVFSPSQEKLGTEFIAFGEHLIDPGSQNTFTVEVAERTKFLGIAVGLRSADSVVWKVSKPIPQKSLLKDPLGFLSTRGLVISINKLSVSVNEA